MKDTIKEIERSPLSIERQKKFDERPPLYVIAKKFDEVGCICYRFKSDIEVRNSVVFIELISPEDTQIVVLSGREVYGEYAPYRDIETLSEFTNLVLNADQLGVEKINIIK